MKKSDKKELEALKEILAPPTHPADVRIIRAALYASPIVDLHPKLCRIITYEKAVSYVADLEYKLKFPVVLPYSLKPKSKNTLHWIIEIEDLTGRVTGISDWYKGTAAELHAYFKRTFHNKRNPPALENGSPRALNRCYWDPERYVFRCRPGSLTFGGRKND